MAHNRPAETSIGGIGCLIIGLMVAVLIYNAVDSFKAIPVGTQCTTSRAAYGVKDLTESYAKLEKSQEAHDNIGLAELSERDVAVFLPAGTACLVIDTDFTQHFTLYRQVRVLNGSYFGKAFWIKKEYLTAQSQTARPVTCRDSHEYLGASGVCLCEEGYISDPATLKCVPR
jgi:hypothetical protein